MVKRAGETSHMGANTTQGSIGAGSSMMAGVGAENSKLGGASTSQKPYSEKVDLNDLDWEDRERVLRLLFSKMNAGVPGNAARIQAKQILKREGIHTNQGGSQQQEYSALPAVEYGQEEHY